MQSLASTTRYVRKGNNIVVKLWTYSVFLDLWVSTCICQLFLSIILLSLTWVNFGCIKWVHTLHHFEARPQNVCVSRCNVMNILDNNRIPGLWIMLSALFLNGYWWEGSLIQLTWKFFSNLIFLAIVRHFHCFMLESSTTFILSSFSAFWYIILLAAALRSLLLTSVF